MGAVAFIVFVIIDLFIISSLVKKGAEKKCHKCGRRRAKYELKTEVIEEESTTVTKTSENEVKSLNDKPVKTTINEVVKPAPKYKYEVQMKCRYCGDITTSTFVSSKKLH